VAGDGELLAHVRRVHPFATTVAVFGRTVNWDLCTGFAAVQAHGLPSAPAFKLLRAHALADDDNLSFLEDGDPDAWLLGAARPFRARSGARASGWIGNWPPRSCVGRLGR